MHASVIIDVPELRQLLVEGGDARITPTEDGVNKYGCAVYPHTPQENLFAFGSATASTISQTGFDAANAVYQNVVQAYRDKAQYQVYENELNAVRQELTSLCELDRASDTDIVFAASGTDLHLIASQLFASLSSSPTLIIMVEPGETGSSIPAALKGYHFSDRSALGAHVRPETTIDGANNIELATVALRQPDGNARNIEDIDDDVDVLASTAIKQHKRVLLILTDVTKTGMIGPSIAAAIRLHQQYPNQLEVMVDACQFRISNTSLHAYLKHQFLVAVTGSKFLTGPSFSGALFFPSVLASRFQQRPIPKALLDYSSRADWPRSWSAADNLHRVANFGLLLRWVAALAELRAFHALNDADIQQFIVRFQSAIKQYFVTHAGLSLLPTGVPDRHALSTIASWDQLPTIFSFTLNSSSGEEALSREKCMTVYRQLQKEKMMQLGQPVTCGMRNHIPVSALRLCLSARLIVAATANKGLNAEHIIENALQVLECTRQLSADITESE